MEVLPNFQQCVEQFTAGGVEEVQETTIREHEEMTTRIGQKYRTVMYSHVQSSNVHCRTVLFTDGQFFAEQMSKEPSPAWGQ